MLAVAAVRGMAWVWLKLPRETDELLRWRREEGVAMTMGGEVVEEAV